MKKLIFVAFVLICSCASNKVPVENYYKSYYKETYIDSREELLKDFQNLNKSYPASEIFSRKIQSKVSQNYFIDGIYLPAKEKTNSLVILTTGIHGLEGFWGNAFLSFFINNLLSSIDNSEIGFLIICNINPFGMDKLRRYTENSVDLNRNMATNIELFKSQNKSFERLYDYLTPNSKLNISYCNDKLFFLSTIWKSIIYGSSSIREAAVRGQYTNPEGIYFGGTKYEDNVIFLDSIISEKVKNYSGIYSISFHTAYGERGRVHYWGTQSKDTALINLVKNIYSGIPLDFSDSPDFYSLSGDFESMLESKYHPNKLCLTMTYEAGTLNSQNLSGSIKLLQNSIYENQAFHHGYKKPEDSLIMSDRIQEMYYPIDSWWRNTCIEQPKDIIVKTILKFNEFVNQKGN